VSWRALYAHCEAGSFEEQPCDTAQAENIHNSPGAAGLLCSPGSRLPAAAVVALLAVTAAAPVVGLLTQPPALLTPLTLLGRYQSLRLLSALSGARLDGEDASAVPSLLFARAWPAPLLDVACSRAAWPHALLVFASEPSVSLRGSIRGLDVSRPAHTISRKRCSRKRSRPTRARMHAARWPNKTYHDSWSASLLSHLQAACDSQDGATAINLQM
jgi:hypothetical protein